MREIKSEIQISAPTAKVWAILIDFNNWKSWNPIVNEVSGSAGLGNKLRVTMKGKDGKDGGTYEPVILNLSSPNHLHWRGKMIAGFLFTNDKIFELKEVSGGTHLVQKETFSGLMVPMFWSKMEKWVPSMLESMNKSLKAKVEG